MMMKRSQQLLPIKVQFHLDFFSDLEKDVFKTAFELNQNWIIELSGDRTNLSHKLNH